MKQLFLQLSPLPSFTCHPFFPSFQTTPVPSSPMWWENVTLSYPNISLSLHDRDPIGIYMNEKPYRMPAADKLCFPYRNSMRLARNVGTIYSAVQATRDVIPIHSCCIEKPSHSVHQFPWENRISSSSCNIRAYFTLCWDVSRDLEGRDLVKRPTLVF